MQRDRPYRPASLAIGALSWGLGASSQVPSLPALEKALALLPTPQRFSCHGRPFGSVFGFSWKSLEVLVCSRCGMGTFSDAFRGFVGMRRPSSRCERSQAGCAGLAREASEQHGGAERPRGTAHPLTSAASCVPALPPSLAVGGQAHPFLGSAGGGRLLSPAGTTCRRPKTRGCAAWGTAAACQPLPLALWWVGNGSCSLLQCFQWVKAGDSRPSSRRDMFTSVPEGCYTGRADTVAE